MRSLHDLSVSDDDGSEVTCDPFGMAHVIANNYPIWLQKCFDVDNHSFVIVDVVHIMLNTPKNHVNPFQQKGLHL